MTELHEAYNSRGYTAVEKLLENGADVNEKDEFGLSIVDLVYFKLSSANGMIHLLRKHGAR